jgi:predicted ATPase/class 3 adenylate cyclase
MLTKSRADLPMPAGTVTFLFTDIEGSTKLWEAHPQVMGATLARHDALARETIARANGHVFKTVGDAFCAAFATAGDALAAALQVQLALDAEPWPEGTPIKVRMALHTGAVETRDSDYFGQTLNRVARLLSTGYGGQTLLSQTAYDLCRDSLPDAASLRDLGAHQLKDLARPEHVYELQHPRLRGDFPPIHTLSTHPNNLPQQLTSFIGREDQIAEVCALLRKTRLLTLTGSGGSGKTRLGLQVAADSLEAFQDGAWLVELAPLTEPGLVADAVATVLKVKEQPGKPIIQTLIEHLGQRRLLLVLDNCEHLLVDCAKVADALVRQCPGVKILASSREALGTAGEQMYRVPSLSLPDRKAAQTPETLSSYESVQLFIDRALLVRTDFRVTNKNAAALASLCHHLEGIPLAIELAAARVRSLGVEEIDGKLDQRFRLLTGGSRTALPRQQTLRALIDWSYDLLDDREQRLLQRLSVFAGGWTQEAAEKVGAGEAIEAWDIFDLLTSLSDKSLVVSEQMDRCSRYRLLETVRQYAREKLTDSGAGEAVRERHRDYYLALAEEANPKLIGADQADWLQRLEQEHENLRAGLNWSVVEAASGGGLRLCGALQRFWLTRGHLAEGWQWCVRILEKAGNADRTPERAKALNAAGALASYLGDFPAARARYGESLAIQREAGDRKGVAISLSNLGALALDEGDFVSARALQEESLAIAREVGHRSGIANSLGSLGNVALYESDYGAARALFEECLTMMRQLEDRGGTGSALNNLGNVAYEQGDYPAARAKLEESLAIKRELGDRYSVANSLSILGDMACDQGNFASARALHHEALMIRRELGERSGIAQSLQGLAATASAVGTTLSAARLWGMAERLREEIGSPLAPNERPRYNLRVAAARAGLGDDAAFDRAWQQGRASNHEHAVELAMGSES